MADVVEEKGDDGFADPLFEVHIEDRESRNMDPEQIFKAIGVEGTEDSVSAITTVHRIDYGPFVGRTFAAKPPWVDEIIVPLFDEESGQYVCKTYPENKSDKYHEAARGLEEILPGWRGIQSLEKLTFPREIIKTPYEISQMDNKELQEYFLCWQYWHRLWFVESFRHYAAECREVECPFEDDNNTFWKAPALSMPMRINVLDFNWQKWIDAHICASGGYKFDVIVTDPPWTLATEKATRGIALNYEQITDSRLMNAVPFYDMLNDNGVIFMWIINAKMKWAVHFLEKSGFTLIDIISWSKMTTNRVLARGHGYYLQHAKEDCIVATKGDCSEFLWEKVHSVFMSEKRAQSQKPPYFYDMVEELAPGGFYLEVFARRNNLRNNWVTIGNQL